MSFRIGQPEPGPRRDTPRSLPKTFSWRFNWRLLLLIAAVILVPGILIDIAPPEFRAWLGYRNPPSTGQAPLTDAEIASESVDTRLPPPPVLDGVEHLNPIVGEKPAPSVVQDDPADERRDELGQAQLDRWSRIRNGLESADKLMFQKVLKISRDGPPLADDDRPMWVQVLLRLDDRWKEYSRQAADALGPLTDHERAVWSPVLEQLDARWNNDLKPSLQAAGEGRTLTEAHRKFLSDLQLVWDQLALASVRDNTVLRSEEADAWFRCFEMLQSSSPEQLRASSLGRVGYLQLYKQPNEYRGKLVTIRGDVRLAYHVGARGNSEGITGYYVYWVKPAGGPNLSLVVYALETPPGFPAVKDKDLDGQTTELDEAVEFTGYFFKNWPYQAQNDLRVTPLLLARSPDWQPILRYDANAGLPPLAVVLAAVLAVAMLSGAFAVYVYHKSRSVPDAVTQFDPSAHAGRQGLDALRDEALSPNIVDSLRQLGEPGETTRETPETVDPPSPDARSHS